MEKKSGGSVKLTLRKVIFSVVCSLPAPGPDLRGGVPGTFSDLLTDWTDWQSVCLQSGLTEETRDCRGNFNTDLQSRYFPFYKAFHWPVPNVGCLLFGASQ